MALFTNLRFESSVILEGSKTKSIARDASALFESSVILEGSKTHFLTSLLLQRFESSVILEGSKTVGMVDAAKTCLRVVLF